MKVSIQTKQSFAPLSTDSSCIGEIFFNKSQLKYQTVWIQIRTDKHLAWSGSNMFAWVISRWVNSYGVCHIKRDVSVNNLCIGYRYCYNKKNQRRVLGLETEQIAIGTQKSRLGDFAPMSTNNLYIGGILILIKTHLVSSSLDPNLA